mmetsp:Transcript_126517/g.252835  ORF Transcript_126517/g.252835 Transcript_126517/m.252835 type:complete len:267 (+) Transcript_126517:58-858(+)|eukprot:CAMPEP_0172672568 /NCGR_PEP_ID=MMETSP1074-20121228/11629_1 /TAXON_ID=2916 /ORGANISM="Ceratium fusus, Strain PA161109" /LENGTH=266 /DNA_ID=CAMNT_0013489775 /DNA_START=46 /DNA_END=846 /DNA_ORIENTATION=+
MAHSVNATLSLDALAQEYVGPYMEIYFKKITTWQLHHVIAFAVVVTAAAEFLTQLLHTLSAAATRLPMNPKQHLDKLEARDKTFIFINKVLMVTFMYHMCQLLTAMPGTKWKVEEATLSNTLLPLIPMYLIFDFFYASFHKLLHLRSIYGYIHKHHHRQVSPTRGHYDAINVHPFEFFVGEYLHLVCFWAVPCHIFGIGLFMLGAVTAATFNHMRFDWCIPGVYDSKDHLVHHRVPDANFGQYTMFWDKLFGWHRSYSDTHAGKTS